MSWKKLSETHSNGITPNRNNEVIEIIGIGKRDKEKIYKIEAKRLKKLKS